MRCAEHGATVSERIEPVQQSVDAGVGEGLAAFPSKDARASGDVPGSLIVEQQAPRRHAVGSPSTSAAMRRRASSRDSSGSLRRRASR